MHLFFLNIGNENLSHNYVSKLNYMENPVPLSRVRVIIIKSFLLQRAISGTGEMAQWAISSTAYGPHILHPSPVWNDLWAQSPEQVLSTIRLGLQSKATKNKLQTVHWVGIMSETLQCRGGKPKHKRLLFTQKEEQRIQTGLSQTAQCNRPIFTPPFQPQAVCAKNRRAGAGVETHIYQRGALKGTGGGFKTPHQQMKLLRRNQSWQEPDFERKEKDSQPCPLLSVTQTAFTLQWWQKERGREEDDMQLRVQRIIWKSVLKAQKYFF